MNHEGDGFVSSQPVVSMAVGHECLSGLTSPRETHAVVSDSAWTFAPAKVNLTLDVLGTRSDGYHEITSLVMGVDLCDRLVARRVRAPDVTLRCSDPSLQTADNLAWRAAELLRRSRNAPNGWSLELTKRIPTGAGLGGGSSDAAAALRLCAALASEEATEEELAALGAGLGSDVPLFFALPSAVLRGRGERVAGRSLSWHGWVLLVMAGGVVPTGDVYRVWRESDAAGAPRGLHAAACGARSAAELSELLSNGLEEAVFRVAPHVGSVHDALRAEGYAHVRVSGAGSALFMLFDSMEAAREAEQAVSSRGIGSSWHVVRAPVEVPPIVHQGDD